MEHEKAEHEKATTTTSIDNNSKVPSNELMDASGHERPVSDGWSAEKQEGVRAIEAISMTWSKWGLIAAYCSIFLMAFTTSLEGQVTYSVVAFATSSFSSHSLIATVYVIQGVVNGKHASCHLMATARLAHSPLFHL
jgi:hypothetical protein